MCRLRFPASFDRMLAFISLADRFAEIADRMGLTRSHIICSSLVTGSPSNQDVGLGPSVFPPSSHCPVLIHVWRMGRTRRTHMPYFAHRTACLRTAPTESIYIAALQSWKRRESNPRRCREFLSALQASAHAVLRPLVAPGRCTHSTPGQASTIISTVKSSLGYLLDRSKGSYWPGRNTVPEPTLF